MKPVRLICLLTVLLLALCLPAQAESSPIYRSREPHLLLENMNEGPCTALTGLVEVMVVFVDVGDAPWTADRMLAMQQELQSGADQLCREAAAYDAALHIRLNWHMAAADSAPQINDSADWADALLQRIPALADRAEGGIWRDTPVIFCCSSAGRAFAHYTVSLSRPEYAVLFEDSDAHTLRHELLHLYGAWDYYIEPTIDAAAHRSCPDSIMLAAAAEGRVDDLTAYIIGWTDEPTGCATRILQETATVTAEDFEAAREMNQFTGVGELRSGDAVYSGMLVDGVYHGWGQLQWPDGSQYAGEWVQGDFHGEGVYRWASGSTYAGSFVEGARTGFGAYRWANGDRYVGDFINGKRHGRGAYFWTTGGIYVGDHTDSLRTGQGVSIAADGTVYTGDFVDGTPHGQGTYTWPDGSVYTGSVADGRRTGQGVCIWADGAVYTGEFLNDQMHGRGTYFWPDGASHTGEFSGNQRHGTGVYRSADGAILRGLWENGEYVSEAVDP